MTDKKLKMTDTGIPSYIDRCYYCKAPRLKARPLKYCSCCHLVAYCNRDCQLDDRPNHKHFCKAFPIVDGKNALYTTGPWEDHIKSLREQAAKLPVEDIHAESFFFNPRVCNICHESRQLCLTDCKCGYVTYCSTVCVDADEAHKADCSNLVVKAQKFTFDWILFYYLLSLSYALELGFLCRIGVEQQLIFDVSTFKIHVISSNPMLDTLKWELSIIHRFEKMMHLEVVFIIPDNSFDPSSSPSNKLDRPICISCKAQNRTATYSLQKMHYHMFFSSLEYTEPDVVVVYGNKKEMTACDEEDIHSDISYRNMIHNQHTILVLMDATEDLVKQGVKAVSAAQPVDVIISPKLNQYRGFSADDANEKYYFACLRRK